MFLPCCLGFVCRQMHRGRRQPHSPLATHSLLFCRHPWSPLPRYGDPLLLPSQRAGLESVKELSRASGGMWE